MSRETSFEDFKVRAAAVHGDSYELVPDGYTNGTGSISYLCPKHGLQTSLAQDFIKGHGCKECGKEKCVATKRANWVKHYDAIKALHPEYEFPDFGKNFSKVTDKCVVVCPTHGEFLITPNKLKKGQGCVKCARENRPKKWTSENMLEQLAKTRTLDTYDYHPDSFVSYSEPMKITCRTHGDFWQSPEFHSFGRGCQKCASNNNSKLTVRSHDSLLAQCLKVHGDSYTYPEPLSHVTSLWTIVCPTHGEFKQLGYVHLRGSKCPVCAGFGSEGQRQLLELVRSIFPSAVSDYRFSKDSRQQIDVYVPELKIGFEYDGIYWHSSKFKDRNWHLDKQQKALQSGVTLYQIFSDEFDREACKQLVKFKLGATDKVFARKTKVVEVDFATAKEFHNSNHVQGSAKSGVSFGLACDGELVAVMTFSKVTSRRGLAAKEGFFELSRFSSSKRVVGGASKLFKFAKAKLEISAVVSYSDNRLFSGSMYQKLGFERVSVTKPDYKYVAPNQKARLHKSNFKHSNLPKVLGDAYDSAKSERENCEASCFYQVFDCGLTKWLWQAK